MKKLGQLLLDFGWIDDAQLEQAIQTQGVVGGRIGTCLLEIGAIDEPMLLRALAHQRSVPAARTLDLMSVPEEVIALLPARVALRCLAVPFRMLGPELYVALLDVANLELHDEIAFASSKQVRIHIGNEVRIFSSLHRYYGRELGDRYQMLEDYLDRPSNEVLRRSGFGRHLEPQNSEAQNSASRAPAVATDSLAALDSDQFAVSGATVASASGRAPSGAMVDAAITSVLPTAPEPLPPRSSAAVTAPFLRKFENDEQFGEALGQMEDREAMAMLFVEHLRPHFRRLLMFRVLPESVTGWLGTGTGVNQVALRNARIDLTQPSIFQDLNNGRMIHQGPLATLSAHRPVVAAFDGVAPADCVFAPVRLGGRLVSVVIGEPSGSEDPAHTRNQITAACSALGQAFGNYLLRSKEA